MELGFLCPGKFRENNYAAIYRLCDKNLKINHNHHPYQCFPRTRTAMTLSAGTQFHTKTTTETENPETEVPCRLRPSQINSVEDKEQT